MAGFEAELRFSLGRQPGIFGSSLAGNFRLRRIWRVPMLHVVSDCGLVLDSVLLVFEPAIPPAHCGIAPFYGGPRNSVVREGVIPRAEKSFLWSFELRHHSRNGVAVAIVKAANEINRNLNGVVDRLLKWSSPEFTVALVMKIEQEPRR